MAKINFKASVKKATVLADLMEGREKIETSDIIKYYPNKITVTEVEEVNLPDESREGGINHFYVYTIKEAPDRFAYAGHVLTKIIDQIISDNDGDIGAINKELKNGGLTLKLSKGETKSGQEVTLVTFVD